MKTLLLIVTITISMLTGYAQGNHVFSNAELVNSSIMDIPASGNIGWSTERTSVPGYFSAINTAAFTGCSDIANINGYIKKYGNSPFIFPVGSGDDLRTLEISSPASVTDAYATAWIKGDPGITADPTAPYAGTHSVFSVTAPIVAVSTAGQWDWQVGDAGNLGPTTTGTGEGLTITVSIPDMTHFGLASSLRLVGWNGVSWTDLSGAPAANGNTENSTLSGTMIAGITAIAVGSVSGTLPLKLESFDAAAGNCSAVIKWTTLNEINTKEFVLQQSTDNSNYTVVTTVKAKGGSSVTDYSLTVSQASGLYYYRLKMIDKDGVYTYSNIALCRSSCSGNEYMMVYPNPAVATSTVYLKFGTHYQGKATLVISNTLGQRLSITTIQVSAGPNILPVNVSAFAAGTYLLTIMGENGVPVGTVQKLIKQ
ncbi:T9SS type A sorting domain-containing protein [Ferruginibacter profundus]